MELVLGWPLKGLGYVFFLTDGKPADEVSAGGGTLLVRRIEADEIIPSPEPPTTSLPEEQSKPGRRGRPPKAKADASVVAVRPVRGG